MKKKMLIILAIVALYNTNILERKMVKEIPEIIAKNKITKQTTQSNLKEKFIKGMKSHIIEKETMGNHGEVIQRKVYSIVVDKNSSGLKRGKDIILGDKKNNFDVTTEEFYIMKKEIETLKFENNKTKEMMKKKMK